jgi:hypothetical protein
VHGRLRPKTTATAAVGRVVERVAADGCDAVVLGGTELPLTLDDARSPRCRPSTRRGGSPVRRCTPPPRDPAPSVGRTPGVTHRSGGGPRDA